MLSPLERRCSSAPTRSCSSSSCRRPSAPPAMRPTASSRCTFLGKLPLGFRMSTRKGLQGAIFPVGRMWKEAEGEIGGPGPAHSLESAAGLAAASEVMKHYFPPFADMDLQPPAGMDNAVCSPLCIPLRQSLRYWLEYAQSSSIVDFAV